MQNISRDVKYPNLIDTTKTGFEQEYTLVPIITIIQNNHKSLLNYLMREKETRNVWIGARYSDPDGKF